MKKDSYQNLEKIVVNVGVGRLSGQPHFADKVLPELMKELSLITGQKPAPRPAKISIAGFKLRTGTIVGLKVTLRGHRMKDFFEKLTSVVLPRVRDFRGIESGSIDSSGNLSFGIKEHVVFPEIVTDISKVNFGMEISIVPKARFKEKAKAVELYRELGIPFSAKGESASGRKK